MCLVLLSIGGGCELDNIGIAFLALGLARPTHTTVIGYGDIYSFQSYYGKSVEGDLHPIWEAISKRNFTV